MHKLDEQRVFVTGLTPKVVKGRVLCVYTFASYQQACQRDRDIGELKRIQRDFAARGVYVCGLNRIEHPYDAEDYLRHFDLHIPTFVDMHTTSSEQTTSRPGQVSIVNFQWHRVGHEGQGWFQPAEAHGMLSGIVHGPRGGAAAESLAPSPLKTNKAQCAPKMRGAGWRKPAYLGPGKYPKLVCFGSGRALCVWVAGAVHDARLKFATSDGKVWSEPRVIATEPDAHAPSLDVDREDCPVLAWVQKMGKVYTVCMSRLKDGQWSQALPVSGKKNNAFRPHVFCRSSGETFITWYAWRRVKVGQDPKAWWRSIYVARVVERRVRSVKEVAKLETGSDDCWAPALTGTQEEVRVSWIRDVGWPNLYYSARRRGIWSAQNTIVRLPRGLRPELFFRALSPVRGRGGASALIFEGLTWAYMSKFDLDFDLYMSYVDGDGWTKPQLVSSGKGRHCAPIGVQSSDGACHLFWWHIPSKEKDATIRHASLRLSDRSAIEHRVLVEGDCENQYPWADADAKNQPWLAWQATQKGLRSEVYVSHRVSGPVARASKADGKAAAGVAIDLNQLAARLSSKFRPKTSLRAKKTVTRSVKGPWGSFKYMVYLNKPILPHQDYPCMIKVGDPDASEPEQVLMTWSRRGPNEPMFFVRSGLLDDKKGADPGSHELFLESAKRFDAFLDDILSNFPIDGNRVYLAGLGFDGVAALSLALHRPDRIAAVAAFAASSQPRQIHERGRDASNMRILVYHGASDPHYVARMKEEQQFKRRLSAASPGNIFKAFAGVDSSTIDRRLREGLCLAGVQVRDPYPRIVDRRFMLASERTHHWVRVIKFSGTASDGSVDPVAKIWATAQRNKIMARTGNIAEVEFLLCPKLVDFKQPIVVQINGKTVHSGPVEPKVDFMWTEYEARKDRFAVYLQSVSVKIP